MPVPAKHPHAWITLDTHTHAGLVIEWAKLTDANGYTTWWADCVILDDGQLRRVKVPGERVRQA